MEQENSVIAFWKKIVHYQEYTIRDKEVLWNVLNNDISNGYKISFLSSEKIIMQQTRIAFWINKFKNWFIVLIIIAIIAFAF